MVKRMIRRIKKKIKKIKKTINERLELRKKDKAAAERLGIDLSMYRSMINMEYPKEFESIAKDWREVFDKTYTGSRYVPPVHHEPLYNVPYSKEALIVIKEEQEGRKLPAKRIEYHLETIKDIFDKWTKDIAAV